MKKNVLHSHHLTENETETMFAFSLACESMIQLIIIFIYLWFIW